MGNPHGNQQKSISERISELRPLLSDNQERFVTLMLEDPKKSKSDAATEMGLEPNTVYKWPNYVDEYIKLAREDIRAAAIEARKYALLKAVRVKIALLDSDDDAIRNKAASDLIEWELGKASQKTEVTGAGGDALRIVIDK